MDLESHELSLALREAVEESENIGVVKELISMGADVNDFKSILANSGIALNKLVEALQQSVEQNSPNMVVTLLQHGVDPNACNGSIFTSAVASQSPELVRLLLRSRSKVRNDSLTRNLPTAVEHGQTEIVSMLVAHGADPSFGNASALRKAVRAQRIDLVLAIMKGIKGNARGTIASSVIGEAFSATSVITVPEQRLLVDILLCAGASGDPVAQLTISVVRAGQQSIAKLLVKHRVNLQYNNAKALRIAVSVNNLGMLSTLFLGKVEEEVASSLIDEIPHTSNDDRNHSIMSLLVKKGAKGAPMSRVLVRAVQNKSMKSVGLLLDHGANVEIDGSQPLRMATTGGDIQMLNLLLNKGQPQLRSIQVILPLILESPLQLRFEMTKSIINAAGQNKIAVSLLDNALLGALRRPPQEFNPSLISLVDILITAEARVD